MTYPKNDKCEVAIEAVSPLIMFEGIRLGAIPEFNKLSLDAFEVNWYTRGVWYKLVNSGSPVQLEYQLY